MILTITICTTYTSIYVVYHVCITNIIVSPFYTFNIDYDDLIYIMNFNHNESKFPEKLASIHDITLLN